jgi:hypothetical protein
MLFTPLVPGLFECTDTMIYRISLPFKPFLVRVVRGKNIPYTETGQTTPYSP